jgi:hypothetical protein
MKKSLAEKAKQFYIDEKLKDYKKIEKIKSIEKLENKEVLISSKSYADIVYRDRFGALKYIEIKSTRVKDSEKKCFGAITQTEIYKAIKNEEHYSFVFIICSDNDTFEIGREISVHDIFEYRLLTCPPTKYYFNIHPNRDTDISKASIDEKSRKNKTMVASVETVKFHGKLSEMNSNVSKENIKVAEENFFSLVTLWKMGTLSNQVVINSLIEFAQNKGITWIIDEELLK